jgi:iron complex outermembrane receptor protein
VKDATIYANAGLPLNAQFELYGFAGFQHREAESAATPRTFNNPNNDPAVYPDGFLPLIAPTVDDYTAAAGVRGVVAGFDADLSLVYGRNEIEYRVENSINGSLVPNSPTSFDAGGLEYDQFVLGLDLVRRFEVGLFEPLNVAFGVETRREHYAITAGELASYQFVPGRPGTGAGSQGFIGFRPSNEWRSIAARPALPRSRGAGDRAVQRHRRRAATRTSPTSGRPPPARSPPATT